MSLVVLSLFDRSLVWSQPFADAGYHVVAVDSAHEPGWTTEGNVTRVGIDIMRFDYPGHPWAVLAAPPCTCFCRPGARWWFKMDFEGRTERDCALFRQALRLCQRARGFWALENPPGRHRELMPEIPKHAWQYQPFEYGDPWGKQTYIWGNAEKPPVTAPVEPAATRRTPNGRTQGRIAFMSSSHKREREKTPAGFARAFFETNDPAAVRAALSPAAEEK